MLKNNFFLALFCAAFFSASLAIAEEIPAQNPADNDLKLTIDKIDPSRFFNIAVVHALNKTTAKTSNLEIKVGEKTKFGQLTILAHKCWQASLDQKPESKILLEIFEDQIDKKQSPKRIFYGWMFASSPSISGLENPIYDITAISCKSK
jgi:hypothetical protein